MMKKEAEKLLRFAAKHRLFVYHDYLWKYDVNLKVSKIIWPTDHYAVRQMMRDETAFKQTNIRLNNSKRL